MSNHEKLTAALYSSLEMNKDNGNNTLYQLTILFGRLLIVLVTNKLLSTVEIEWILDRKVD